METWEGRELGAMEVKIILTLDSEIVKGPGWEKR